MSKMHRNLLCQEKAVRKKRLLVEEEKSRKKCTSKQREQYEPDNKTIRTQLYSE